MKLQNNEIKNIFKIFKKITISSMKMSLKKNYKKNLQLWIFVMHLEIDLSKE